MSDSGTGFNQYREVPDQPNDPSSESNESPPKAFNNSTTEPQPAASHNIHMAAIFNPTIGMHNMWFPSPDPGYPYQQDTGPPTVPRPQYEVESFSPSSGAEGQTVTLLVRNRSNFAEQPFFSVIFQEARVMAVVEEQEGFAKFLIKVLVPCFANTHSVLETVSVSLCVQDVQGNTHSLERIGNFTYTDTTNAQQMMRHDTFPALSGFHPTHRLDEPGEVSGSFRFIDDNSQMQGPADDSSSQLSLSRQVSHDDAHLAASWPLSHATSHSGRAVTPSIYALQRQQPQRSISEHSLPARGPTFPRDSPTSTPALQPFAHRHSESPTMSSVESTQVARQTDEQWQSRNPALIRTSTLQAQAPHLAPPSITGPPTVPHVSSTSRAVLQLNGDLDSMIVGWTQPEAQSHRRLVEFSRHQQGNRIIASFKPISQEQRKDKSICISCIWWPNRQEAFITSVDTIYLLESLVAVKFTVEEKNRIRRNLEGFRPLTVSKTRADSEDFFKIIMGFSSPRPRHIEKDIKVFPWKILNHALNKIIGKYSASYTSAPQGESSQSRRMDAPSDSPSSAAAGRSHTSLTESPDEISRSTSPQALQMSLTGYSPRPDERMASTHVQYGEMGQGQGYPMPLLPPREENSSQVPNFAMPVNEWSYEPQFPPGYEHGEHGFIATPSMQFGEPIEQHGETGSHHQPGEREGSGSPNAIRRRRHQPPG